MPLEICLEQVTASEGALGYPHRNINAGFINSIPLSVNNAELRSLGVTYLPAFFH